MYNQKSFCLNWDSHADKPQNEHTLFKKSDELERVGGNFSEVMDKSFIYCDISVTRVYVHL